MPRVIVIERKTGEAGSILIRDAQEYLDHPGYTLALIVGKQHIFYRLYAETPSVVMGIPKLGKKKGEMGVECMALGFGELASLVERKIN